MESQVHCLDSEFQFFRVVPFLNNFCFQIFVGGSHSSEAIFLHYCRSSFHRRIQFSDYLYLKHQSKKDICAPVFCYFLRQKMWATSLRTKYIKIGNVLVLYCRLPRYVFVFFIDLVFQLQLICHAITIT